MKKGFSIYALCWAIVLAVFNVVVFLAESVVPGFEVVYDGRFWTVWAFIILAFIGNLVCAYLSFAAENSKKFFYRLSLIKISYSCVIAMLICGGVLLIIPLLPVWIAGIVCILILAFNIIAVIKATAAAAIVEEIDESVSKQTQFIKMATADAENIMKNAESEEIKASCKKVFEAIRYSDPMSNSGLSAVENKIYNKIGELGNAASGGDSEQVKAVAEEIIALTNERNIKCKALK